MVSPSHHPAIPCHSRCATPDCGNRWLVSVHCESRRALPRGSTLWCGCASTPGLSVRVSIVEIPLACLLCWFAIAECFGAVELKPDPVQVVHGLVEVCP